MHHQLAKDSNSINEPDLRRKMQTDPSGMKDLRLKYIQDTPYFETDKCWYTENPPTAFPHYNGI